MYAKHYENPTMLSRVTAKNVGDVFFETHCTYVAHICSLLHLLAKSEPKHRTTVVAFTANFLYTVSQKTAFYFCNNFRIKLYFDNFWYICTIYLELNDIEIVGLS